MWFSKGKKKSTCRAYQNIICTMFDLCFWIVHETIFCQNILKSIFFEDSDFLPHSLVCVFVSIYVLVSIIITGTCSSKEFLYIWQFLTQCLQMSTLLMPNWFFQDTWPNTRSLAPPVYFSIYWGLIVRSFGASVGYNKKSRCSF